MQQCVSKLNIVSDNGLSSVRRQAIISTNPWILSIGPLGRNFGEILMDSYILLFKKMHLKMSSENWRPFGPGLNALNKFLFCNWHSYITAVPWFGVAVSNDLKQMTK